MMPAMTRRQRAAYRLGLWTETMRARWYVVAEFVGLSVPQPNVYMTTVRSAPPAEFARHARRQDHGGPFTWRVWWRSRATSGG